jgi:serine/threonine protein kinase
MGSCQFKRTVDNHSKHNGPQSRYEIRSTIAVGATSRVEKAHDTLIDRTVALKTFGQGFGSPELQRQFLREAQILGRLSHPNIVSIYDLGADEGGSAFLVMEYVPGKTLESILARQEPIPLERVAIWAADLSSALNRAHRGGVIHGDVKPANIFVTDEGHIKLGDFGIARFATQVSGTGKLVGTPAYLSPEQIKGEPQDHRSDIFSLGIILYQLATGVRPFDGSSVTAVCAQIVAAEPVPPSQINRALPKEFDQVVMRCLAKDPSARYPTGDSLAASLYPFARGKFPSTPKRPKVSWWKQPLGLRDAWICLAAPVLIVLTVPAFRHWQQTAYTGSTEAKLTSGLPFPATSSLSTEQLSQLPIFSDSASSAEFINLNGASNSERGPKSREKKATTLSVENLPALPKAESWRANASLGSKTTEVGTATVRADAGSPVITGKAPTPYSTRGAASLQVPLIIEIASTIDGEVVAIYADQKLIATSPLSITSAGEVLRLERSVTSGPHEFRVALYRQDQSLHLERDGLAEIQSGISNVLSIHVVKRAKMLIKHDAALEIFWPGAIAARTMKQTTAVAQTPTTKPPLR